MLFFVDIVEQSGVVVIEISRVYRRFCFIERATDREEIMAPCLGFNPE